MAQQTRIYLIHDGHAHRLVSAAHPSHAVQHVARGAFQVRVATQQDLETLLPAGVKVETIRAEQQELPTT